MSHRPRKHRAKIMISSHLQKKIHCYWRAQYSLIAVLSHSILEWLIYIYCLLLPANFAALFFASKMRNSMHCVYSIAAIFLKFWMKEILLCNYYPFLIVCSVRNCNSRLNFGRVINCESVFIVMKYMYQVFRMISWILSVQVIVSVIVTLGHFKNMCLYPYSLSQYSVFSQLDRPVFLWQIAVL